VRRFGVHFPQSIDLRFSLYYRNPDRICSTLEEQFGQIPELSPGVRRSNPCAYNFRER
jgi:hypothetical protein